MDFFLILIILLLLGIVVVILLLICKKFSGSPSIIKPSKFALSPTDKRLAIILIHKNFETGFPNRLGTDRDVEKLITVLPPLGFGYLVYDDLTIDQIMDIQQNFRLHNDINWNKMDSMLIFVLSDETTTNTTEAFDKPYIVSSFIDEFHPDRFTEMRGKTKLFFIFASRDTTPAPTSSIDLAGKYHSESIVHAIERHSLYNDLVVVYATTENAISVRDSENGTFFIQSFDQTVTGFLNGKQQKYLDLMEFYRILNNKLVQRTTILDGENVKQIGQIVSTLKRPYYFENSFFDLFK